MSAHPFWFALVTACVVWYSTITIYVAIRGVWDIRHMLERLRGNGSEQERQES